MSSTRAGLRANPWVALSVLSLGLFMTLLDVTIVNVAIPQLIDSIGASFDEAVWVINAYLLVLGVALITAGRLGDLYGPRNVFLAGIALFTLASAACGLASSPGLLIAARAVQGLGAALLTPQSLSIVLALFAPERRGAAFSVNGITAGVASAAGPTLGGVIVTQWDWRGIFFVNLPVGIVTIVLTLWLVPDVRPGHRHRLDLSGVTVASLGLVAITFALIEGQRYSWGHVWAFVSIPLLLGVGVVLLAAFVVMQRRRQHGPREPLVPFALFADRNYTLMNVVSAALQLGLVGLFLPFTIYLQSVLGLNALQAGLVYVPSSAVSLLLTPVVGRLVDRIGGKLILITGLTAFAAGLGLLDLAAGVRASRWAFVPGILIIGAGTSAIFVPLFTLAMGQVKPQLAGAASGVLQTTRQLGGVLGTAAVGALLQNRLAASLHDQARQRAHELPVGARHDFIASFAHAARGGLDVGAGQTGNSLHAPTGLPRAAAQHLHQVGVQVFDHGFAAALHPSLLLPVIVLALAALASVTIRPVRPAASQTPPPGQRAQPRPSEPVAAADR